MAKRVQLVLNKDVSKLGRAGDVVDVAPGYARNYLLPQGLAVHTSPGILKQVERRRELERQRLAELKAVAETTKAAIEGKTISIAKQVGEKDAIFGTVTAQEVADAILATTKQEVDRRNITLPDVHQLGSYQAELKLHPEVAATINIEVVPA
jgi:large subunit ribosomal protein L9